MDMLLYIAWGIGFVLFVVFELLTTSLTTIWFAGGSLFALASVYLGFSPLQQIGVFLFSSIVLLVLTKPFIKKYADKLGGGVKTNVDALVGSKAVVTNKISEFNPGLVKVAGSTWTAVGQRDDAIFRVGDEVEVVAVSGVKLVVKKIN